MKKLYCNQYTDEIFDSEEKALASEQKYLDAKAAKEKAEAERKAAIEKKNAERAVRAKEVEEALKVFADARKDYVEKLNAFCKDYGSFHYTTKGTNPMDWFDLITDLFNH